MLNSSIEVSTQSCPSPTHHLNVGRHSGEEVQQLVVVNHVRIPELLGELVHTYSARTKRLPASRIELCTFCAIGPPE